MATHKEQSVLDFSRERLAADLPIGGRVHVHGKDGGYFYEKMPDGTLKETFVPRRKPEPTLLQKLKARFFRRFP